MKHDIVDTLWCRIKAHQLSADGASSVHKVFLNDEERALHKQSVREAVDGLLHALLIDTRDPHSEGTADRVARMLVDEALASRYGPTPLFTTFRATTTGIVHCGPLLVRSMCAHHMVPIVGHAHIVYIPGRLMLGISKADRMVDWYARRAQTQETMSERIADHLEGLLEPRALLVYVQATHHCRTWRGVNGAFDSVMTTSCSRGAFDDDPATKAEAMAIITQASHGRSF